MDESFHFNTFKSEDSYDCNTFKSEDIDVDRLTIESFLALKELFPAVDNDTLGRYLIAKNNDVIAAADQLRRTEQWKAEYWHVKKSQCLNEINTGKAYLQGHDKDGRPLLVLTARLHDTGKRDLKEMLLMTLWWTEQAIARLPPNKSRFTILLDRDNCDQPLDTEYLQRLSEIFQVLFVAC